MKLRLILILTVLSTLGFGSNPHKANSVLATGNWWKIAITREGIYKITYQDLADMNMDPDHLDPASIRLYGNGTGMLPEANNGRRTDDLREVSLKLFTREPGAFRPGDYLLFYGESPDAWVIDKSTKLFSHKKNLFSDSTYYYITSGGEPGARVTEVASLDSTPGYYCRRFIDHTFIDKDSLNLIKSGRLWVGDVFDNKRTVYDYPVHFPDIDTNSALRLVINVVAKSPLTSRFLVSVNGEVYDSVPVDMTDPQSLNIYASSKKKTINIAHPPASGKITLKYTLPTGSSLGWLDYLEFSAQRNLVFSGTQMTFRDPNSVGTNKMTQFILEGTHPGVKIWDVTEPGTIKEVVPVVTGSTLKFTMLTDTLREFIAFDTTGFLSIKTSGPVKNQNLHALQPAELVIVSHPRFASEAERLAAFHRDHQGMSVLVLNIYDLYEEFACGEHDLTAIRDFMKMLFDKASAGNEPKYLLLFGDGTYDPKDRIPQNNNYIPTYQSTESLRYVETYVTDDYYGIMEENGGADANGKLAIGIGRFPVTTSEDAKGIVDKIIRYSSTSDSVMADWRNKITFIADDENTNLHFHQAEQLAEIVRSKYPVFNVGKIYLDAYRMVPTPLGYRLPQVNDAITKTIGDGTLILNYTGHGGEDGWAGEKVLTVADIMSWKNFDKLPVFVTATCEFSRFDNPERLTGGEMTILNPDGGAIALYSTTRLALATSNFKLDTSFFSNLMAKDGGENPRMGNLIRISKNNNGNNRSVRNFVLLGDPAQAIAFPANRVRTTMINQRPVDSVPDTTLGLTTVRVKGVIEDVAGNKLTGFSGKIYPVVFDKPVINRTLGNTTGSYPENFALQNSIFYKGISSVTNGDFEFSFVIPKGISLQLGKGKISYYSRNDQTDANGYYDNIIMGGTDPDINPVNPGPVMAMYMDSTTFISGQRVGKNTEFFATLTDPDGINAYGLGIGHEIMAVLDNDQSHPIDLNPTFQPTFDKFGSGTVNHAFSNLSNGLHTLQLKAWDLYDNSATNEITFLIFDQPTLSVNNLTNLPNPVQDHTVFSFTPVKFSGALDIRIQIFTSTGYPVRTLEEQFQENGLSVLTIPWDVTGDNGQYLPAGLYIYRLVAKGSNGAVTTVSQKMVVSH